MIGKVSFPCARMLAILTFATACSARREAPTAPILMLPADVATVPTEVLVGGKTLRLTSSVTLDLGAISSPLSASLEIGPDSGLAVPSGVRVVHAWMLLDNATWEAIPSRMTPARSAGSIDYVALGGPSWPRDALVTTVVELVDSNNRAYLLRGAPVAIGVVF